MPMSRNSPYKPQDHFATIRAMGKDLLPTDYQAFLATIKARIQQAQLKAMVAVNTELTLLYWQIGRSILERQQAEGWGTGVIDKLSADLHAAFPEMQGFSPRNLKYMRAFAEAYPNEEVIVQRGVAQIPWRHNIALLEKLKENEERFWYIEQTIKYGWTRDVLVHQIASGLFKRQGKAITNFIRALPSPQSELAQATLKDPYIFDFLTLAKEAGERALQTSLLSHIQKFLLELGIGFTFVGSNYHLTVEGDDYYLDLLFYHIQLRCFVVIELKTHEFKPEYAGKMNFYLKAIDETIKHPADNPTIGIILCETKKKITAEYTLSNIQSPMGVATYQTGEALPEDLKDKLPDIKLLEERLEEIREENQEKET
jgi:predicted nuclease of restriction endonuclease-like (RecB) superfamily